MGVEVESSELHTRVASWLTRRGILYIHEYKNKPDFVTINPQTGEMALIECKVSMDEYENEFPAQEGNVETFEDLLNEYGEEMQFLGAARSVDSPHRQRTRQAALDTVARLQARQITPELIALYHKLQAGRHAESVEEGWLYPSEQERLMEDIVLALGKLIEGGA